MGENGAAGALGHKARAVFIGAAAIYVGHSLRAVMFMSKSVQKTNAMRILEREKIPFVFHEYDSEITDGVGVAKILNQDEAKVFKTLVTEAAGRGYFVFVIPVAETLDLKKAAKAAGQKSLSMLKQKELFPLTGYIHGGCSPIGMKKLFPTFIHESAETLETICVSAGRVGCQAELSPGKLASLVKASFNDLIAK